MPFSRRHLLAALAALPLPARAQGWAPMRPIRFIVPFPAGGSPDVLTRLMAPHLQASLGQPVVVENRPGAGATIGGVAVARSEPDGHTILVAPIASLVAPLMMPQPPYDTAREFRPVGLFAATPTVLVVRRDFPAQTVQEWDRLVRASGGRMTYASGGVGTPHHLAGELYRAMTGVEIQHVPFRGTAPALTEIIGGRVDFMFADLPATPAHLASGALRALAVGTGARVPTLPSLPTMAESVLPGFEAYSWVMWWVPAGVPEEAVLRLNEAGNAALRQPDVTERSQAAGFVLMGGDVAAAAAHLAAESAKWSRVIRERGLRFEG
jgi:tripartite-type tricarboxylate transporter receptor subunit TctC